MRLHILQNLDSRVWFSRDALQLEIHVQFALNISLNLRENMREVVQKT